MTHRPCRRGRRPAFTLIELLVVISIIAILVGLTSAAVMRALITGPRLQTNAEIHELEQKLSGLKSLPDHAPTSLPSMLHLSKKNLYSPATSQLDKDSMDYLQSRFGKQVCCKFTVLPSAKYPTVPFIDWNGDGVANEELFLEGEQCLVFHLAGVPTKGANGAIGMIGFSNNALNPAQAVQTQGESRIGPYFEFQSARLVMKSSSLPGNTGQFPVYLDPHKTLPPQPYAYFASYNTEGGGLYNKYGTNDCLSLGVAPGTLLPYIQSTTTTVNPNPPPANFTITNFVNPGSFQIISAGRDGKFGVGGVNWNPAQGTADANGKDDQANFSPNMLGVPAN